MRDWAGLEGLFGSHVTTGEHATHELGRALGDRLAPGACVLLRGDLGAGKTAFIRGLACGLGADPDEVSSPTFTIVQRYQGRLPLYHVDLYRLDAGREVDDLALDDLAAEGGVVAVEWAERLTRPLDDDALEVAIDDLGGDRRRVTIGPTRYSTR